MTSPNNSPPPEPTSGEVSRQQGDGNHQATSDLVFTQDAEGQYLSFFWRDAHAYGLSINPFVGQSIERGLAPVAIAPYAARVHYVLKYAIPQQFKYPFRWQDRCWLFSVTISPFLVPCGTATVVVVMGHCLGEISLAEAQPWVETLDAQPLPDFSLTHYRRMLTQVARNVRRRLDLDAIWQKTVDGLGEALSLSRCLIFPYTPALAEIMVAAEFRQPHLSSRLGLVLPIQSDSSLEQALQTLQPVAFPATELGWADAMGSVLAIATHHKDQPNSIITLHHSYPNHNWSDLELELIQELADQIGTDIAHATLFAESQSLAAELRDANARLRQKHQELEEAHKNAEEASRLKSEFLANTSHELRTPLNGMIGFLKLVLDGMADDPEEQQEFIEEAHRSAVHLLNIINDILDIAKIEAGKMALDLDPVNLDDLMSDVENFTRTQAQQKNLHFEILTPDIRDPVILYGNYQRLLQVMLNLVGNAIKFTHEGSITISAEVIQEKVIVQGQERPGMVKISVADTGIGVSLEKQNKLFQNFSQVDSSRTRQYGGTGLGLAISQKLVEAMGGVVNFFSLGEGLGATVAFTVPLFQDPIMISTYSTDSSDLLS